MKPLPANDLEHILEHTREIWKELRGQRIFLTGATGFFGMWLLESLAYCNHALDLDIRVTVLCRDPEGFLRKMPHISLQPGLEFLQGDVRQFDVPKPQFDFILHAAAPTSTAAGTRPEDILSVLLDGTRRMLALARNCHARRFLFVSSGAVYGKQPAEMPGIPEDHLGGPDWVDPHAAYAEGKRIAEQMCSIAADASDIQFRIARCFAFVGPHLPLSQHFAIGNFIRDALGGSSIEIRGDGTPLRSYLYAADLAIWLWTMLLGSRPGGTKLEVLNVGSGESISIRELARTVADELRPELLINVAQKPSPCVAPLRYVPDVSKAERVWGLRQSISLRDAIRRTAAWYRT